MTWLSTHVSSTDSVFFFRKLEKKKKPCIPIHVDNSTIHVIAKCGEVNSCYYTLAGFIKILKQYLLSMSEFKVGFAKPH